MTDVEFLASLMDRSTGPRLVLPRTDYLRLLRLAGLEDAYRLAASDERNRVDLLGSVVSVFIELATERLEPAPSGGEVGPAC